MIRREIDRRVTASHPQKSQAAAPRVRRLAKRGRYDRATLDAILDAGLVCHIGFVHEDAPVVIPTLYWRNGSRVYWHGSRASRMLRSIAGARICLTVTHLDGLVLARSAFHHSANYRSAVLFGRAAELTDRAERLAQLEYLVESLYPGRWTALRPVKPQELAATRILYLEISEFSAKVREGQNVEDRRDVDWPVWAGVIPLTLHAGIPQADDPCADTQHSPPATPKLVGCS
ncbi:pyridoxamine 5'-phosphate oxidase family protein [Luteimonas salinilitoris]|uniref:Pyridoxamine 5'-phosphate oxidase family protein n=1 Tax=Luteimonas salinilitoris TaxID=3237697 RepID=A0ABV4HXS4_9GAMM